MPNYECPFRLGDIVIPVEAPSEDVDRPPFWVWEMQDFVGQKATVTDIDTMSSFYVLQLDISGDYNWKDSWLKHAHTDYTLF